MKIALLSDVSCVKNSQPLTTNCTNHRQSYNQAKRIVLFLLIEQRLSMCCYLTCFISSKHNKDVQVTLLQHGELLVILIPNSPPQCTSNPTPTPVI